MHKSLQKTIGRAWFDEELASANLVNYFGGSGLDAVVVLLSLDRAAGYDALVVSLVTIEAAVSIEVPSPDQDHAVAAAHAEVVARLPDPLVSLTMHLVASNADPGAAFVSLLVALVNAVAGYIGLGLVVV